jgi:hypothetical protein
VCGVQVVLAATAEGVSLSIASGSAPAAPESGRSAVKMASNGVPSNGTRSIQQAKPPQSLVGPVNRVNQMVVFAMMDSSPANCGAKAAGCARLEQVLSPRCNVRQHPLATVQLLPLSALH